MSDAKKLSKKEKKSLQFRKSKEEREADKQSKEESKKRKLEQEEQEATTTTTTTTTGDTTSSEEQPKKKRKTRRGKKGKGVNDGKGPRFILFVGNLPHDIKQAELIAHFHNSSPDRIRVRPEKGIAFLEFDNDTQEIQSKMELALRMHHSELRTRRINVELTVGGGGNSEARLQKLKEKNEKKDERQKKRIAEDKKKKSSKTSSSDLNGVHPSRAALMQ
ncbi:NOP6 [Candida theae]|uniref:NOP6 n=1 Tax=Candida theae TaxID=1198502 RepID=A0AAD5FYC8_9ASCO|nr:NOP6 [Candida theae]KAI5957932.1 NOP6 [Candida theae]